MSKSNLLKFGALGVAIVGVSLIGFTQLIKPAKQTQAVSYEAAQLAPHDVIASGEFSGRSDHVTTGNVKVIKTATGYQLILGADFTLDGAPDPIVGFGKDGTYLASARVSSLQSKKGAQTYDLPDSLSLADLNEVYIWCEKFAVPLGAARLTTS